MKLGDQLPGRGLVLDNADHIQYSGSQETNKEDDQFPLFFGGGNGGISEHDVISWLNGQSFRPGFDSVVHHGFKSHEGGNALIKSLLLLSIQSNWS
jgi:hypothetical protein